MLTDLKKHLMPYLVLTLCVLGVLSTFRLGFSLWQYQHFSNPNALLNLLIGGLRIDLSTLGYLLLIPALISPLALSIKALKPIWLACLKSYLVLILTILVFLEMATPMFIEEYGLRPNRLFVEYLVYPKEVFSMLMSGHSAAVFVTLILLVAAIKLIVLPLANYFVFKTTGQTHATAKVKLVAILLLLAALILFARGTLGHRPINPAYVFFSNDALVNSLTLNSTYSVFHAVKALLNEKNASKLYGAMPEREVINIVRQETGLPTSAFTLPNNPLFKIQQPSYLGAKKNLVIILEESLGAQYVKRLNGLPLTPNIDSLYQLGWGFDKLYATGTRSVRGIEAVVTGFTPTPARAVVKLDKSQKGFFTLASLLQSEGYNTQFIYGGESHFDNMKSFFLGNGFQTIVDFDDIDKPNFVGSWGASDQDVFTQANTELNKLALQEKPFFSLIFTSSNHDPFEIPNGAIKPFDYTPSQLAQYDDKERARHKAIQYADLALGEFINTAKTQSYWQNTLFLIVADHDARALGQALVPVNNFHIPAIILNSEFDNQSYKAIASQIDLAPTLLSLMGVTNQSPMIGRDLTQSATTGRALMQYADNFAYYSDKGITILQPGKKPKMFDFNSADNYMSEKPLDHNEAKVALAHALWGSLAYQNGWHAN
ncbi:LTA synthase family protein [Pseudoalteromonas sp. T1lg24]|uniref:LTA synthase family protein n=1 Tax=Pseudoalteromonas sp. T1lg24 TaxID=2077099 RepID=UPI0018F89641|nr:LTA synthase family protein [Pseudoalteromonas sp. T1lg24]